MKRTILIGTILAVFLMLMVPNISALNNQAADEPVEKKTNIQRDEAAEEKTKMQSFFNLIAEKVDGEGYDWPLLCLMILGIGIASAVVVFVLSLALGRIGTALSNAIVALVGVLQLAATILGGLGIFAGAVGTILVWIDYLKGAEAAL